jgi:hypothetical protein
VDRHLLPDEIDQLLDGEVGFGIAPLRAHARQCAHCRAELEGAQSLVSALEHLPLLSPSPAFAERVMAHVQVFIPWHVAAQDTIRGWLPRSRPARAAAATVVAAGTLVLTALALFVLTRFDVVAFATGLALQRARALAAAGVASTVASIVGQPAASALRAGGMAGIFLVAALALLMTAAAARALRALAVAPRRN